MKQLINESITSAVSALNMPAVDFTVEHPQEEAHGDYATNVALVLFPFLKNQGINEYESPRRLAEAIANQLRSAPTVQQLADVTVAGPGFINFTFGTGTLIDEAVSIQQAGNSYGTNRAYEGQRIVVEYTDPNPFKEFHIGHLYSNSVGESIARLFEASGAKVWRADYFGDVGLHVAKSVWGMRTLLSEENKQIDDYAGLDITNRQRFLGKSYALGSAAYEANAQAKTDIEILNTHLYAIAQETLIEDERWQKKIDFEQYVVEPGKFDRAELKKLYRLGRAWSLEYFETLYKRLGTKFNGYYPESKASEVGYRFVMDNLDTGVFTRSNGAIVFEGEKHGLHTRVFINSHNLPTYEAKELGLAPMKYQDFPYTKSVVVTGNEINEYFKVLITALKLINPELGNVTTHIGHGMVRLPEGKMSSRTGKVITGDSLVDEAKRRSLTIMDELNPSLENKEAIADDIGVAAIKFAFLKSNIGSDIVFTFDEALSFNGMSGPYLQYTYARSQSVLRKASEFPSVDQQTSYTPNAEEQAILRWLYRFPEMVEAAAQDCAPHMVCQYLYELAGRFNTFYNKHSILGNENQLVEDSTKRFRLLITQATSTVLANGLRLLGIAAPEKM